MVRVGRRIVRRQFHDRERRKTIVRVPGGLQRLNRLDPVFDCEVNLAMDERKEFPVVKVALRQRHIHVKELRIGAGTDQLLREGRELRGSVNRDFQHRGWTRCTEFVSFYLSGAETTGSAAEQPEYLLANGWWGCQIACRHKEIDGPDTATILAEEPDNHALLCRVDIKKPSPESSRGTCGFQESSLSVAT